MSKETGLVSVIVTIFNMDEYLERFLKSLASQTYRNIQVLLVDDGSRDRSYSICEAVCKEDPRFRLIYKENGGVSSARQLGLENATGEFIIHADPDDLIPSNAIKDLVETISNNNADIAIGNYVIQYPKRSIKVRVEKDRDAESLLTSLLLGRVHGSLCNKLVRKSLCDQNCFLDGVNYMEDKLFLIDVLVANKSCKLSYSDSIVYHYFQRKGSYTNSVDGSHWQKSMQSTLLQLSRVEGIIPKKVLHHVENKARLIAIINSDNPILEYRSHDYLIISDDNINTKYKIMLWFLSKRISLPISLYNKLKYYKNRLYGIY